jgi:1-deoxyxylulose-5-phosphate synthase
VLEVAKRDTVVIASKVFQAMSDDVNDRGLSRKHIMRSIDNTLRRLGTDYVDLYQIHRFDDSTPVEETMEALHDVVKAGKALYLGASSMYAWQFAKLQHTAQRHGWTRFSSMQNHYNLIYREEEREMLPLCVDQGVGVIPWSPLARGFLAGNRTRDKGGQTARAKSDEYAHKMYYSDSDFEIAERVGQLAAQHNVPNAQIAMAWLLHKAAITAPIIGASKPGHLEDAIAALDIALTADDIAALEAPYQPRAILGHA